MSAAPRLHVFTAVSLFAGAVLFQFATPLAISAQSRSSIRVGATVLPAAGTWEADALVTVMAQDLARAMAGSMVEGVAISGAARGWRTERDLGGGPSAAAEAYVLVPLRRDWGGTAVWVEPPPVTRAGGAVRVTVAHLAN